MKRLEVSTDYTSGHLRYSTYTTIMSDEDYEKFMKLSRKEQEEVIKEEWEESVDYEIDDRGELGNITGVDIEIRED